MKKTLLVSLALANILIIGLMVNIVAYNVAEAQSTKISVKVVVDGVEKFTDGNVTCYVTSRSFSGSSPFKYESISCLNIRN